jgi:hypothetical protein
MTLDKYKCGCVIHSYEGFAYDITMCKTHRSMATNYNITEMIELVQNDNNVEVIV